jgi:hypothetical protein
MTEKFLERKLRERVKLLGGMALKLASPYHTGMPDRLVLMPEGRTAFAEIKTPGKKPTELQQSCIRRLRQLGFTVAVIDSAESLNDFLDGL